MTDPHALYPDWQRRRRAALVAPDGWLNIIARVWLAQGSVSVGSAADNDIVLSAGPAHVGTLTQDRSGAVRYQPADASPAQDLPLSKSKPPRFTAGTLLLEVTTINGENALRVRDTASQAGEHLQQLQYFPYDPSWRITADWVALGAPRTMTISTSKAIPTDVEATHKAVFTRDGVRYELLATHGTPEAPQFVIRDATAGDSTYPACRFVLGEDVSESGIVLDFNKAINPPCAFTEHAVCPLPPPENVLPIRIEAGEKRLLDAH